jgi:hypothetical protein
VTHDDAYAQANGHPPSAAKTVCIDFDGTICPWGPLTEDRPPFLGARVALRGFRDQGYRIVILTSRASLQWWEAEARVRGVDTLVFGFRQLSFVAKYLNRWGLDYDEITSEKVPALAYFDDRAVRVEPVDYALSAAVYEFFRRQDE